MRILIAGASGVLGRSTLRHLAEHDVVGLTRHRRNVDVVEGLGARGVVCDVHDYEALHAVARRSEPQVVVNFLTALSEGVDANNRVRREGAANVQRAAEAVGAARLVVESVAFLLRGDAASAVEKLERSTLEFAGDALVLRFGRFWGPGTFHETPPDPPAIHISQAGQEAARLIIEGARGTHTVA